MFLNILQRVGCYPCVLLGGISILLGWADTIFVVDKKFSILLVIVLTWDQLVPSG